MVDSYAKVDGGVGIYRFCLPVPSKILRRTELCAGRVSGLGFVPPAALPLCTAKPRLAP